MSFLSYPVLALEDRDGLRAAMRAASHGLVLEQEGLCNDLTFHINRVRRERDYGVSDRILTVLGVGAELWWAIHFNKETILAATKSVDILCITNPELDLFYRADLGSKHTSQPVLIHTRRA